MAQASLSTHESDRDADRIEIVTLDASDLGQFRHFCGRSPKYAQAYENKRSWLQARFAEGMRYKLLRANGRTVGFLEYLPGECAWRGVAAEGYLFIHCFWVLGKNKGRGYGTRLLDDCLKDAQEHGFAGVAVLTSFEHWLPNKRIFVKQGFEQVDAAPPAFELFVKRWDPIAPLPKLMRGWRDAATLPNGLTMFASDQCPYIFFTERTVQAVADQLNVPVAIVRVETARQAQQSPCPYGVMGIFYDGRLLSYRPIGAEELIKSIQRLGSDDGE
jgi:ribosomal protein S18 acetylase RimI-like enzyme